MSLHHSALDERSVQYLRYKTSPNTGMKTSWRWVERVLPHTALARPVWVLGPASACGNISRSSKGSCQNDPRLQIQPLTWSSRSLSKKGWEVTWSLGANGEAFSLADKGVAGYKGWKVKLQILALKWSTFPTARIIKQRSSKGGGWTHQHLLFLRGY